MSVVDTAVVDTVDSGNATEYHEYKFDVKMTCGGCSGAITRALSKVEGITYDVSLEKQEVIVRGSLDYETVLEKIKKTGKEVRSGTVVV